MNDPSPTHLLSPELIHDMLESAPDATIIVDRSGTIVFANSHTARLFGYGHDLVGSNLEVLLPERYRQSHAAHRNRYMASARPRPMGIGLELLARRQDGTEFPVEISLSPAHWEPGLLVIAAIRDMTPRVRIERELRAARAEAERANLAKSRFLATASHDLRQPLQVLALLNATLRRQVAGTDVLETIAQQNAAIETMGRLLNALLDISKLESGAIEPVIESFPVAPLFEQLRAEFAEMARAKGLALTVEPAAATVRSDVALVAQILRNLLSNAIKYTERGSVTLACREEGGALHVDVSDTGIGIPREQLAYIFDEFFQVGVRSNESHNGYGLGLSIVQRIAKLLHLRIDVTSEVGAGSTFSVVLPPGEPIAEAAAHERSSARMAEPGNGQRHILLVEAHVAVRNAMQMFLRSSGYRVSTAVCVAGAAGRAAEAADIDLILCDLHLADGRSGIEAVTAVRQAIGRHIGAIIVTGDTSPVIRELALDAHTRIASKPIRADEMLTLIQELLAS